MEHKDGFGHILTRKEQIKNGILKGTTLVHALPIGVLSILSDIKEKDPSQKSSLLENIAASATVLAESYIWYELAKNGFPSAYVLPAINAATTGFAAMYAVSAVIPGGFIDRMNNVVGGHYGSLILPNEVYQEDNPQLELPFYSNTV